MNYPLLYVLLLACGFLLTVIFTPLVKKLALRVRALDIPNNPRKIHTKPMPLLGGWAVIISFVIMLLAYLAFLHPDMHIVPIKFYVGILIGAVILMIGGFLDDKYNLPPKWAIIAPVLAVLAVVVSGIGVGITQLSNPFGHPIMLNFLFLGIPFSGIFVYLFIIGMTYTTKFLDGIDGLVSGITIIAALTLFFLSLTPRINQPITASLALILVGVFGGFLVFNFNPASIFLGESGSTFAGFILATLSVLLGGKIATAILVMGVPILDISWAIIRRIWYGTSPFQGDRKHLHLRLLDIGFSQRQTVLILYALAICFGAVSIVLQARGKLFSLIVLFCVMVLLGVFSVFAYKAKEKVQPKLD
jgi:UDP-GlcNAc:undecaprenyl-phosphate GlcNAc-1-phosphate transferase